MRLDGADVDPERIGRGLLAEVVEVAKDHDFTLSPWQVRQSALQIQPTFQLWIRYRRLDQVDMASRTRPLLIRSLELLKTKHEEKPVRKHGNIPL